MESSGYMTRFIESIKGPFKQLVDSSENNKEVGESKLYESVLYQGYLDAARTFALSHKWNDSFWTNLPGEIGLPDIREKTAFKESKDFDETHKSLCESLIEYFKGNGVIATYGQAQKIINMAFKYLYCYDYRCEGNLNVYKYCHMPLDSFTMTWYKRHDTKYTGPKWSKIEDYDSYLEIQTSIRDKYTPKGKTVLLHEFQIWEDEKRVATLHDVIKGLKDLGYSEGKVPPVNELQDDEERLIESLRR